MFIGRTVLIVPNHIKTAQLGLEIFKMSEYFLDKPHRMLESLFSFIVATMSKG